MRLTLTFACLLLGACGPTRDESFTRIAQFAAVNRVAAGSSFVFFVQDGTLHEVPVNGGRASVLLTYQTNDFAVGGDFVYAATTEGVYRLPERPSGEPNPSQISGDVALAVAADARGVSWASCTQLTHASPDGSNPVSTPLSAADCSVNGTRLVLDASTVYGVDQVGLWYASRRGGPITHFSTLECTSLAVGAGWVYCANSYGVWGVLPASGRTEHPVTGAAHDLAADGDQVFVALEDELLALGQSSLSRLTLGTYANITAVSAAHGRVYFVNTESALGLLLSTSQ